MTTKNERQDRMYAADVEQSDREYIRARQAQESRIPEIRNVVSAIKHAFILGNRADCKDILDGLPRSMVASVAVRVSRAFALDSRMDLCVAWEKWLDAIA